MGQSIGKTMRSLAVVGSVLVLAACGGGGGGGGSGGDNRLQIDFSLARDQLPLDVTNDACVNPPSPWASNATVVSISASRRVTGELVGSGDGVFECNVMNATLEQGALYYFRGREDDRVEISCGGVDREIEAAYREIVLPANAGGASFHVLSGPRVGPINVRCMATDPATGDRAVRDFTIQAGGPSSGRASQVVYSAEGPNWLYVQGVGGPTQLIYQVEVVDEAGQRVPNPPPGTANLLARIVSDPNNLADNDAVLRAGGQSGKSVAVSTINGEAQFTVVSGTSPGWIGVEFFADRADGNVQNGIAEPIFNAIQVPVVIAASGGPLTLVTAALEDAYFGTPYAQFVEVTGGALPYTFGLGQGTSLPPGLSLTSDGVIIGTPTAAGDNFGFIIEVTDALGVTRSRAYTMNVNATGGAALAISTDSLPNGTAGNPYTAVLEASGGVPPYTWSGVGNTAPFTVGGTGFGTVTAAAPVAGSYNIVVQVQDANGITVPRAFAITIAP